jgi:hypothetical protein
MRAFIENSREALKVLRQELAADLRLVAEEVRRWLQGIWPWKDQPMMAALPPASVAFQLYLVKARWSRRGDQASLATISSDVVQRRAAAASSLPRGHGWAGLQSR